MESEFSTQDVTNIVGMHSLSTKGVKWTDKLKDGTTCACDVAVLFVKCEV